MRNINLSKLPIKVAIKVDTLICEGTTLSGKLKRNEKEEKLNSKIKKKFRILHYKNLRILQF